MNKHSLIPTASNFTERTQELTKLYTALETCLAEAVQVEAILKEAKSNLCEALDFIPAQPDPRKHFGSAYYEVLNLITERTQQRNQRRIVFYAARLRVQNMIPALKKARTDLISFSEEYREVFEKIVEMSGYNERDHEIGRCNVFFCNQLAFEAFEKLKELNLAISHGVGIDEHWSFGVRADLKGTLDVEHKRSRRIWVVKYSGNGGTFHFDSSGPDQVPPGPYLTYDEAKRDAQGWELTADTIGGMAQLYNVETGDTVNNFHQE